jgi:predicted metal-dependent HD superfamily phosphohydrolase
VTMLSQDRWTRLCCGAVGIDSSPEYFNRLVALYSESHRHYHNQQHIADCLREFDQVRAFATEPNAVEMAIWFHDAVYDPRASDNEERSADLAVDFLKGTGAGEALVNSVRQLILATKAHDGSLHADAPLRVDVDLSILGSSAATFWEYENGIRAEYAWVDPKVFASKRAEILEHFLSRSRLYHTEFLFTRLETQARANLRASIEHLRRAIMPGT